ncbi:unnamed protein product [Meloidogyne enterolobii]
MTTTKGKHCELKSSPSDFNLYGCHCSSLWNNTDIDHDVRAPVDDVDQFDIIFYILIHNQIKNQK